MNDAISAELLSSADPEYADFTSKMVPEIKRENIIGVRLPVLRQIAKKHSGSDEAAAFMRDLPHRYLDQNNLHSALISRIKDPAAALEETDRFLPFIDNWATCDTLSPKCLKKALPDFYRRIDVWLRSDLTYTLRFAIVSLMSFFLDDAFDPEYPLRVAEIKSEEYYVRMAQAWYFATALAKQYEAAIPYLEERRLDDWTHNKTIQKAVESFRVTDQHKEYLKSLRIKTQRIKNKD